MESFGGFIIPCVGLMGTSNPGMDVTALGLWLEGTKSTKAPVPNVAGFCEFAGLSFSPSFCDHDDTGTCGGG